jgi:hypothetical protein
MSAERLSGSVIRVIDGSLVDIFHLASPLFPGDRLMPKVMVYSVFFLETAQTAISSYDVYSGLAQKFGSTASLDSIQQHWLTVPIFGALSKSSMNPEFAE